METKDICVDFDGTIVTHEYPDIGHPVPDALPTLRELRRNEHNIILFTMRSGEELDAAVEYVEGQGVQLYGINQNPTQSDWTESPKAYGQVYIDDAALGVPLVENSTFSDRPFVDWSVVRHMLKSRNILPNV